MKQIEHLTSWIFAIFFTLAMLALFNAFAKYVERHGL